MLNSKQVGTLLRAMEKEYGLYPSNYCVSGSCSQLTDKAEKEGSSVTTINVFVSWQGAVILSEQGLELVPSMSTLTGGMGAYDGCFLFELANNHVRKANQEGNKHGQYPCNMLVPEHSFWADINNESTDLPF